MKIKKINITNAGYVQCKSNFYSSLDVLQVNSQYEFSAGINKLYGEIDSGVWAVSYLLSMYTLKKKDFVLFNETNITVNDVDMSLKHFTKYSCYMDEIYPLFATSTSIKKLVMKGINDNNLTCTTENLRNIFGIDSERFEYPLSRLGNERFKAMAAIGYCNNKQVFCFPWLSKMRFENYHNNMTELLEILAKLEKIVIVPIGE